MTLRFCTEPDVGIKRGLECLLFPIVSMPTFPCQLSILDKSVGGLGMMGMSFCFASMLSALSDEVQKGILSKYKLQ